MDVGGGDLEVDLHYAGYRAGSGSGVADHRRVGVSDRGCNPGAMVTWLHA